MLIVLIWSDCSHGSLVVQALNAVFGSSDTSNKWSVSAVQSLHCKDRHSFVMLYKQYVRPHQLGRPGLPRTRSWSYCRWRTDGLRLTSSRPSKSSRGFNDVNREILFTLDGENPTRLALHGQDPLNNAALEQRHTSELFLE